MYNSTVHIINKDNEYERRKMKDWKERLEKIMEHTTGEKLNTKDAQKWLDWLSKQVKPALDELADKLNENNKPGNRVPTIATVQADGQTLQITEEGEFKIIFEYTFEVSSIERDIKARRIYKDRLGRKHILPRYDGPATSDTKDNKKPAILDWTKDIIINDFIEEYENWKRWET